VTERYAIYYAPPADSPLWAFGCRWLGRDPESGTDYPVEALPGFDASWLAALTAMPRHYGFHATLKPPFALAADRDGVQLQAVLTAFAAAQPPVVAPPLELAELDGFLALRPAGPATALEALAAECVRHFDRFRAPPAAAELAQRRRHGLTPRQEALLAAWGYPYVLEEFRFHLTLTGRLEESSRGHLRALLAPRLAPLLGEPLRVNAVALFHQPDRQQPFRLIQRFPLLGAGASWPSVAEA